MPRKPIDYSKTHFYKIVCKDTSITDCYVGHTTDFTKRQWQHKNSCKNQNAKAYNFYVYQFIRDNGEWDNWEMILINVENCKSNVEARQRERYYKEQLKSSLNVKYPLRTRKEYDQTNSQEIKQYKQEYQVKNKGRIKVYKQNKYEEDKEKIEHKHKQYYENNKEAIFKRIRQVCVCECGSTYTYGHKARHLNTRKHQKYINSLQDE